MSTTGSMTQGGNNEKLFMYASIFLYKPKLRSEFMNYAPPIQPYEGKQFPINLKLIQYLKCFQEVQAQNGMLS